MEALATTEQARAFLNPIAFAQLYFRIKDKRQRVIPLRFNPVQRHYLGNAGRRTIVLKARQIGISTASLAWFLHDTITHQATTTSIIGHDGDAMQRLLETARTMLRSIPASMRPATRYDNKGELYFDRLGSRLWIGTFRSSKARSGTVNNLLCTEVAFWESTKLETLMAGFTESVPMSGKIVVESTPNGIGGWYYRQVQAARRGDSSYQLLEYAWFCNPEYRIPREEWPIMHEAVRPRGRTPDLDEGEKRLRDDYGVDDEQLMWRRWKIHELGDMRTGPPRTSRKFAQEYGKDFLHSGNAVFDPEYLVPKCRWKEPVKGHRYLHGADTAEGVEGGNWNVLETIDLETGEFVHQVRCRDKADGFAKRIHDVCMRYGGLLGVECNNTGHAVLLSLAQVFAESVGERGMDGVPYRIFADKKRLGILSNERWRKANIIDFESALRDGSLLLARDDDVGLTELKQWRYNSAMKECPPEGEHDDTVDAKRWAWEMRKYYDFFLGKRGGEAITARIVSG